MLTDGSACEIAIVGGGCSGVLVAAQLLRRGFSGQIRLIEPRAALGRGLAYSTSFAQHLLNVPAEKMSAFPDQPSHFVDWLRTRKPDVPDRGYFAPRMIYGEYLQSCLPYAPENFAHVRGEVLSVGETDRGFTLTLTSGAAIRASRVVLALGNPVSSPFPALSPSDLVGRWHASPWLEGALTVRFPGERILLIGTGLTAVDAALALHSQSVPSQVSLVSRRGIIPATHAHSCAPPVACDFLAAPRLRPLLRQVRRQVEDMRERGLCWRTVLDSLRPSSNALWLDLSVAERAQFFRHLKPYWEPHRHRMAPQVRSRLDELLREGRVRILAGRIRDISTSAEALDARIRLRRGGEVLLNVDRVVNCSGVQERYNGPMARRLIRSLISRDLAEPNDLGIGFRTDAAGALATANGGVSSSLFTLGPPRRGELFETTAVPEIRAQAEALALHLIRQAAESIPADLARSGQTSNLTAQSMEGAYDYCI